MDHERKELYWHCVINDIEAWVLYIFKVAEILTSSPNTLKDFELVDRILVSSQDNKKEVKTSKLDETDQLITAVMENKPNEEFTFTMHCFNYDTIALEKNGNFLCINTNEQVIAEKRDPGAWESFTIQPIQIAIKAHNGRYVFIENDPRSEKQAVASKDEINNYTTFILTKTGDSTYTIKNTSSEPARYLIAPNAVDGVVTSAEETTLLLSRFTLQRFGYDRWAIKTIKGFYLGLRKDGKVIAIKKITSTEGIFSIEFLKVALRTHNGKYLRKVDFGDDIIVKDTVNEKYSLFEIKDYDLER